MAKSIKEQIEEARKREEELKMLLSQQSSKIAELKERKRNTKRIKFRVGEDYTTSIGKFRIIEIDKKDAQCYVYFYDLEMVHEWVSLTSFTNFVYLHKDLKGVSLCNWFRDVKCCKECCRYEECKKKVKN